MQDLQKIQELQKKLLTNKLRQWGYPNWTIQAYAVIVPIKFAKIVQKFIQHLKGYTYDRIVI